MRQKNVLRLTEIISSLVGLALIFIWFDWRLVLILAFVLLGNSLMLARLSKNEIRNKKYPCGKNMDEMEEIDYYDCDHNCLSDCTILADIVGGQ